MKTKSQRGVALVVTLIMLSVITFLTVAFLALSRRDKASMTASASLTDSKFAADAGFARAKSEIMAQIRAATNVYAADFTVSRNFINPAGFDPAVPDVDTNNVNYEFTTGGVPLNNNQVIQNIANLYFDPRVPVYVATNEVGSNDFRFYYDLNRNRRFETNGGALYDDNDAPVMAGTNVVPNPFPGDPEWIGVLEKPELPHSPTNRFVSRYAFWVSPEGKSLDVNFMHNYARGVAGPMGNLDQFSRNQGVGSWELNLAAFFAGLNTNYYGAATNGYLYDPFFPSSSQFAFEDALAILKYRYASNTANLPTIGQTLGVNGATAFRNDDVDGHADGPLWTNVVAFTNEPGGQFDDPAKAWAGSKNPNGFYEPWELLDTNKVSTNFVNRLRAMGNATNSYDRYSFYRLLSDLGTHSTPEKGKIHLNYDNLTTNTTSGFASQTNFIPWTPLRFFTNAAEAMIKRSIERNGNNFLLGGVIVPPSWTSNGVLTNIQVYPTNQYTPTLHRLLQLAANIYAATTVTNIDNTNNWPFVFRPQFRFDPAVGTNGGVFISSYVEVTGTNELTRPFRDLNIPADRSNVQPDDNVYGVPWVLSAKKGFPNFNEFSFETVGQVTRKLKISKPSATTKPNATNQMFLVSITNRFGLEFWNSYKTRYNRQVQIIATNSYVGALTNRLGTNVPGRVIWTNGSNAAVVINTNIFNWPASTSVSPTAFVTNSSTLAFLPESQYINHPNGPTFFRSPSGNLNAFEKRTDFYVPEWGLALTNRVLAVMIDTQAGRIIDFVNFDGLITGIDVSSDSIGSTLPNPGEPQQNVFNPTLAANGVPNGVLEQIRISLGYTDITDDQWKAFSPSAGNPTHQEIERQRAAFRAFMLQTPPNPKLTNPPTPPDLQWSVPYTPTRRMYRKVSLEVNDPLVHYVMDDLIDRINPGTNGRPTMLTGTQALPVSNIGQNNLRYSPWGTNAQGSNLSFKDPLVRSSDDWDFSTNKFPNIGWLGRVHRGTPWQTMYLKSSVAPTGHDDNGWWAWSGSDQTHPTNDWKLLDLFTTAPNENASRGLLSVNANGTAAWSAVLGGVITLSNAPTGIVPLVIDPTSTNIQYIVNAINAERAKTNHAGRVFSSLGEVLAVPQLTEQSPFLNLANKSQISDAVYERVPQQILSLLKTGESRYVIYSVGQSLKPAENSIVLSGQYQNLCTNYQVTGEVMTRTVIRVDEAVDPVSNKPQYKTVIESFNILPEE